MTKNLQKIAATLLFLAIPQEIENKILFIKREPYNIKTIEVVENNSSNYKSNLIYLNDVISSNERKKDFLLMRLQENISDSTIRINYKNKLNETEMKLNKYYSEKDSISKLIKR